MSTYYAKTFKSWYPSDVYPLKEIVFASTLCAK